MRVGKLIAAATLLWAGALVDLADARRASRVVVVYAAEDRDRDRNNGDHEGNLDRDLAAVLSAEGFTGDIERTFRKRLEKNLGRKINPKLVDLGRMLWFDKIHSLRRDNTCGGCHSPTNAFGDSQPMAIGVQNNNIVGPDRKGPRNQRRTPAAVNIALHRPDVERAIQLLSGDPFDNSLGFRFPSAEGDIRFSLANDIANHISHLAQAQGEMPPTELTEAAGYTGTCPNGIADPTLGPRFCQFDDGLGLPVPMPEPGEDGSFSRNNPIRREALKSLNGSAAYRRLFGEVFPEVAGSHGKPIDFHMFGRAIAEFEFTLVFANAPLDQFARGDRDAMTSGEKRFANSSKAGCATCHYVTKKESSDPEPNEMFSDFEEHVIGVPQIAPRFGKKKGNTIFDGPGEDEDFGLAQVTGSEQDRYKFRTAPLRNLALAPAFFHNGAFIKLEDAIRFHLNVHEEGKKYNAVRAGVPEDLTHRLGPVVPKRLLDPLVRREIS